TRNGRDAREGRSGRPAGRPAERPKAEEEPRTGVVHRPEPDAFPDDRGQGRRPDAELRPPDRPPQMVSPYAEAENGGVADRCNERRGRNNRDPVRTRTCAKSLQSLQRLRVVARGCEWGDATIQKPFYCPCAFRPLWSIHSLPLHSARKVFL